MDKIGMTMAAAFWGCLEADGYRLSPLSARFAVREFVHQGYLLQRYSSKFLLCIGESLAAGEHKTNLQLFEAMGLQVYQPVQWYVKMITLYHIYDKN